MKINLFETSIYVDNIDCSRINLKNKNFTKQWCSEVSSSYSSKNILDEESIKYLIEKIGNLLYDQILKDFKINIINIWQNNYNYGDFQEKHIHQQSHFSFIIYKKIIESKTVFFNPIEKLITCFYSEQIFKSTNFFKHSFEPKCRQDQIILFPSYLEHMVKKSDNSTTISGNILIEL